MSSKLIHGDHEDILFCSFLQSRIHGCSPRVFSLNLMFICLKFSLNIRFMKWKTYKRDVICNLLRRRYV